MKWGKTYFEQHQDDVARVKKEREPKEWFAWYPIRLSSGERVWRERVKYRKTDVLGRVSYWQEAKD